MRWLIHSKYNIRCCKYIAQDINKTLNGEQNSNIENSDTINPTGGFQFCFINWSEIFLQLKKNNSYNFRLKFIKYLLKYVCYVSPHYLPCTQHLNQMKVYIYHIHMLELYILNSLKLNYNPLIMPKYALFKM